MKARVAVAGAGIYGSTIAIRLAERGHDVCMFDPLGILRAASAINQYRIHAGYHYPRSPETIREALEARAEFTEAFAPAIVRTSRHYYAIPREGSFTHPNVFESVMAHHHLPCRRSHPGWMNFDFIDACYDVDEQIYDPELLREVVASRVHALNVRFEQRPFLTAMRADFDFVIYATYGMGPSLGVFKIAKYQVAEKILIELPDALRGVALVVIDGPFTAFDPYGASSKSLFGSAKNTNHWTTTDPRASIPEPYAALLNAPEFRPIPFTRFEAMRDDSALAVPASKDAKYLGSRFTIRVVEDNPAQDRRTLYIHESAPGEIHVFSGKVVSAVKAARLVCERIADA
ncbi:MAG TPA: FAD-dependent oxidoreductase [Candidatus Aquilonibacter sp.]|nr:FAD-dependent oxidoreductase [Candidatus Aquilonibacter sp.]